MVNDSRIKENTEIMPLRNSIVQPQGNTPAQMKLSFGIMTRVQEGTENTVFLYFISLYLDC